MRQGRRGNYVRFGGKERGVMVGKEENNGRGKKEEKKKSEKRDKKGLTMRDVYGNLKVRLAREQVRGDRKSTRLNSSHT